MFGLLDLPKMAAAAALGFIACYVLASVSWIPAAREGEASRLSAATQKAIGELTNEADRARVNRRLCIERGGLYFNATGVCGKRPDPVDG